ncbi:type IV pili methyl-accepting chemotaxis transducer N-terminal domain-containing protein [Desulfosporosinus hippei]|uniref:type IV pili methyl-accepting chemotaxis transducer N-terminal domain-containing protein n=1 Tax=Desulfosporosinus hippei TaxID=569859 RepID=UPI001FA6B068|nr:type IV pili methyl-accepting chemotaxis transducer N-terminal domain-containing protein [Desulfosporosinus hippei]
MHQVISTQSDSALLVNISGSQRWLSQKAALLSVELVYSSNTSDRKQIREQLSETIAQLQLNHQTLIEGSTHIFHRIAYHRKCKRCILAHP